MAKLSDAEYQELVDQAMAVDLPTVLEDLGFHLERDGKQFKVSDTRERVFRLGRGSGAWVIATGGEMHNPIKFIQEYNRCSWMEALYFITGRSPEKKVYPRASAVRPPPEPPKPLVVWYAKNEWEQEMCMDYCSVKRGISKQVIAKAMEQKFLAFTFAGPAFCGFDPKGVLKFCETRRIVPLLGDDGKLRDKLSASGTDKSFSPVLIGRPAVVHVVEGGFDALAVWDIAIKLYGGQLPSVIMTGGSGSMRWLHNPLVVDLISDAKTVIVWCENEKAEDIQSATDSQHIAQAEEIDKVAGRSVAELRKPLPQFKDLAIMNQNI